MGHLLRIKIRMICFNYCLGFTKMLICLREVVFILTLCVYLGCGCSFSPVNTPAFSDDPDVKRIDPNNGPFVIELEQAAAQDGNTPETIHVIKWKKTRISGNLKQDRTLSAKYRDFNFRMFSHPAIEVEMPGGQKYTALLDSGYSGVVYVNDLVVRRSNLAVFPLGEHSDTGCAQGFCDIPSMKIGTVAIENPRGWYEQRHWQLKVLGVPIYRHELVLIGLDMMSKFSYILFDNTKRKATFSPYDEFEPVDSSQWIDIPFVLEKIKDSSRLMVNISLGGHNVHVEFDTCGGKTGLILRQDTWKRVAESVQARGGRKTLSLSFQYGWHWPRQYVLPELQIGRLNLKNVKVDILPADEEFIQDFEGLITLDCFKKTALVLDFKKNLLWIRKF